MCYEGDCDGFENMLRDQLLLDAADSGQFGYRVYGWNGPWVSVGRFQSETEDLVNPSATKWVRRPTGGKAVLHGHDITVGLAIPLKLLQCNPRSVISAYRAAVRPLIVALQASGVPAQLAADTAYSGRGKRSGDCFAFASPNDIVDELQGKKICGCALRLTQSAVLVQASIPTRSPLVVPESVIVNAVSMSPTSLNIEGFCLAFETSVRMFR